MYDRGSRVMRSLHVDGDGEWSLMSLPLLVQTASSPHMLSKTMEQDVFQKRLGSVAPQICSYCEWRGKCDRSLIVGRWRHYLRDQQLATGGPLVDDDRGKRHYSRYDFLNWPGTLFGATCRSLECWKLSDKISDEWIGKANWDLHFFFSSCVKKRSTRSKLTFKDLHLAHMMKIIMQMIFL
jgi:hypothetical protein